MRVRVPAQRPLTLEVVGDMLTREPAAEETAAEAARLRRKSDTASKPFLAKIPPLEAELEQAAAQLTAAKADLERAQAAAKAADEWAAERRRVDPGCGPLKGEDWQRYIEPHNAAYDAQWPVTVARRAHERIFSKIEQLHLSASLVGGGTVSRGGGYRDQAAAAQTKAREEAIVSPFLPLREMFIVRDICATCGECLELEQLLLVSHHDLQPLTTKQLRESCRCHCPIDHSFMCEHVREQRCVGGVHIRVP